MTDQVQADRIAREIEIYKDQVNIHDLPKIFHYWSNKFLRPHLAEVFGQDGMHDILASELRASIVDAQGNPHIVSVGSGDGCVEIGLAKRLLASGFDGFRFHCFELSPHLVARAEAASAEAGLGQHFEFHVADLSQWRADRTYGAAFAHHSLHHIEALEHVFDQVHDSLETNGAFVTADMIGRNGHMRWPEVLAPLEHLWSTIPAHYKFHHLFGRSTDPFLNWDCSGESFEGIRAQDIMPCLVERFEFKKLCVWGGMLDVFIDRGYGHNLLPDNAADMLFIDRVWAADCALLNARATTPTQMLATMRKKDGAPQILRSSFGLQPEECIRRA